MIFFGAQNTAIITSIDAREADRRAFMVDNEIKMLGLLRRMEDLAAEAKEETRVKKENEKIAVDTIREADQVAALAVVSEQARPWYRRWL